MDIKQYKEQTQPTKKLESLNSYRNELFDLRSSGYSYSSIGTFLNINGISVSEHTIRRFFKKHAEDFKEYKEGNQ